MNAVARRLLVGLFALLLAGGVWFASESSAQDKGKGGKSALTFEIYKDKAGGFRWRLKAANGQVIGTSGQGYAGKADCKKAIESIQKGAASAKVTEAPDEEK